MFRKIFLSSTFLLAFCALINAQTERKLIGKGIINGAAISLPKPTYPQEAKDFCASGQVQVEVLIGEDGNVISAKAISGDELLRESAVEAAKRAKFRQIDDVKPVKIKGIVVYNFPAEKRCIEKGVINNQAIYLPKPVFPKSCRCEGIIKVRVLVDVASGKVVAANAFSGNPLLRASAVAAARQTKFAVAIIDGDGKPVYVKAFLVYKFNPDGMIEF